MAQSYLNKEKLLTIIRKFLSPGQGIFDDLNASKT